MSVDLGVPVTHGPSFELTVEQVRQLKAQLEDIELAGVKVTRVHVDTPQTPPRFYIKVVEGKPLFEARITLEAKHYGIGQTIGEKELAFYVSKRLEEHKGWGD